MTMTKNRNREMADYKLFHPDDEENDIMHTRQELHAILTFPDVTGRSFDDLKNSILESSFGFHSSGRPISMRDLSLQYHVSLRTVAYALNPGLKRSVEEDERRYAVYRNAKRKH